MSRLVHIFRVRVDGDDSPRYVVTYGDRLSDALAAAAVVVHRSGGDVDASVGYAAEAVLIEEETADDDTE